MIFFLQRKHPLLRCYKLEINTLIVVPNTATFELSYSVSHIRTNTATGFEYLYIYIYIYIYEFLFRSVFLLSIIGSSSQSFSMLISFLIVL